MTEPDKIEQSLRTILRFLNEYVIKHPPFTSDFYKQKGIPSDMEMQTLFDKLNASYRHYLNGDSDFCKVLINDLAQAHALRKGNRENTDTNVKFPHLSDDDFEEFCRSSDTLQIIGGPVKDTPFDFIVIPGALQGGVEKRMNTALDYLKRVPFQGQILVFGTQDRRLYPFTSLGEVKEPITFEILADTLNKAKGSQENTAASVQKQLMHQYQIIKQKFGPLKETEIADILAQKWECETGLKWPTEYQMVYRLANKKLKFRPVQLIETSRRTTVPAHKRATSQDEAFYIADKIQKLTQEKKRHIPAFVPSVAIVTHYGYQVETYREAINRQLKNTKIEMMSPYKGTKDFLDSFWAKKWQPGKSIAELRGAFVVEVLDAFARLIYSQHHKCHLNEIIKAWQQKKRIKNL